MINPAFFFAAVPPSAVPTGKPKGEAVSFLCFYYNIIFLQSPWLSFPVLYDLTGSFHFSVKCYNLFTSSA